MLTVTGRNTREAHILDMHVRRGERERELNTVQTVEGQTSVLKSDHSMDGRLARITQKQEEEAKKLDELLEKRRANRGKKDPLEAVCVVLCKC